MPPPVKRLHDQVRGKLGLKNCAHRTEKSVEQSILTAASLVQPAVGEAIQALRLPRGGCGLDLGCGTGLHCRALAEAVGESGSIIGLDISQDLLALASGTMDSQGLSGQVSFVQGDARRLPFRDACFEFAWSCDLVGYAPSIEPFQAVRELSRVVRPGGTLAIIAWSSETLLPGYPLLEAHLKATAPGIAPFFKNAPSETHQMLAAGFLRRAGLQLVQARTFTHTVLAPLSPEVQDGLECLIEMRWPEVEAELSPEDAREYRRLCSPGSPNFILSLPDYCAIFSYTMFWGAKP